jgi:hypothetical protein
MKFKLAWIVGLLLVGLAAVQAAASVTVNVTYTADNVTAAVVEDGSSPEFYSPGANAANWKQADTLALTLEGQDTYQVIFRVNNDTTVSAPGHQGGTQYAPGNNNPAGFLAQITGAIEGGQLLSSSLWEYAIDDGTTPADFNSLTWHLATAWGWTASGNTGSPYNGGTNIWTSNNGGPISGISTSAQWIWGPHNGIQLGDSQYAAENYLWIRATIATQSGIIVPEPATILVWSLLGAASWLGMRVWRQGRHGVRPAWSEENRVAIFEVIERGRVR